MNIHIPCMTGNWGDNVPSLWISEFIKANPDGCDAHLTYNDQYPGGRHTEWVQAPWLDGFHNQGGRLLCTHHRHHHALKYPMGQPFIYFDAYGAYHKFMYHNWYPTFTPTPQTQAIFDSLNLPAEYDVVHISAGDIFNRNAIDPHQCIAQHPELAKTGVITLSTDRPVPGAMDISNLPPWVKIMVMIHARQVVSNHTGFTSIPAMYRKGKGVFLINQSFPKCFNLGPPIGCYENVEFNVDPRPIYYAASVRDVPTVNWANYYNEYCMVHQKFIFETFYCDFPPAPDGYEIPWFTLETENALVPKNIQFRLQDYFTKEWSDWITLDSDPVNKVYG